MHESSLEKSDHWDTTEKTVINGGTSTRVITVVVIQWRAESFSFGVGFRKVVDFLFFGEPI